MEKWLQKVTLKGNNVELFPLEKIHAKDLLNAEEDGQLHKLWFTSVPSKDTILEYIENALSEAEMGRTMPFVVKHLKTNKIVGSTRYLNASPEHRRLEIGATWYSKCFQRTNINTENKFLLLTHAFENLDCIAVEFRTDWFNFKSREAILRLGAKQDGVLRNHRINPDGSLRDSVVFSITREEWPAVKKSLHYKLKRAY